MCSYKTTFTTDLAMFIYDLPHPRVRLGFMKISRAPSRSRIQHLTCVLHFPFSLAHRELADTHKAKEAQPAIADHVIGQEAELTFDSLRRTQMKTSAGYQIPNTCFLGIRLFFTSLLGIKFRRKSALN